MAVRFCLPHVLLRGRWFGEDEIHRGRQNADPLTRLGGEELGVIEAVEHADHYLVLLLEHVEGLVERDAGLVAVLLGVIGERLLQLIGQAKIIDDEPARLVLEHAIDASDRLHQAVPLHRLIDVHRVQAGSVEPGQPHVADDHELQRILRVLEPLRELFARFLVPNMRLPTSADRTRSRSSPP